MRPQTHLSHLSDVSRIGLPLIGGQLGQFAIGLTDTVMMGWYGVDSLAAMVLGASQFFVFFIVTLGIVAVALGMTGLDFVTAVSGASAALANIGPGLGEIIGPAGNFAPLNDTAKWILSLAMLLGRLELMAVYAILTVQFWRA